MPLLVLDFDQAECWRSDLEKLEFLRQNTFERFFEDVFVPSGTCFEGGESWQGQNSTRRNFNFKPDLRAAESMSIDEAGPPPNAKPAAGRGNKG